MVARICRQCRLVSGLRGLEASDVPVLRRELPLGPRDALGRPAGCLAIVDGPLEVRDGALHVAAQRLQARAAAQGVEILVERGHALVRALRLRVLADLQLGVPEDPEGMTVGRIQRDRLRGLGGRLCERVTGVQHVSEMAHRTARPRRDRQGLAQGFLGQREVLGVPGLPGLLDVCVAEPVVASCVDGVSSQEQLRGPDPGIRRRLAPVRRRRSEHQQDRHRDEYRAPPFLSHLSVLPGDAGCRGGLTTSAAPGSRLPVTGTTARSDPSGTGWWLAASRSGLGSGSGGRGRRWRRCFQGSRSGSRRGRG